MSQIINELAKIEVSDDVLQRLDIGKIYDNFRNGYQKLDNLKNFRTEYEKQNAVMRWWHNDKIHDAQLDSAEVQAEFSKAIGQLMMINIMQSKKLSEQQSQLNEQQGKLKSQADGIVKNTGELQNQNRVLAEQSAKLKTAMDDYFKSKGLTEDDVEQLINVVSKVKVFSSKLAEQEITHQKKFLLIDGGIDAQIIRMTEVDHTLSTQKTELVNIIQKVKATKQEMLQEFDVHAKNMERLRDAVTKQIESVSSQVNEQFRLSSEWTRSSIQAAQKEIRHELDKISTKFTTQNTTYQDKFQLINGEFDTQNIRMTEVDHTLSSQKIELTSIAKEIKITKDGILQEFDIRTKNIASLFDQVAKQIKLVSSQVNEQFHLSSEENQSSIQTMQKETRHELDSFLMRLTKQDITYQEKLRLINDWLNIQSMRAIEVDNALSTHATGLTTYTQQQKNYQAKQELFQKKISDRLNILSLAFACSSVIAITMLFFIAHIMKWI